MHCYSGVKSIISPYLSTLPSNPTLDAFGRTKTQREGYLYFTAHGKEFLYCASPKIFTPDRLTVMGQALCKHENFGELIDIILIPPKSRTMIFPNTELSDDEQVEFDNCQIVYLSCHPKLSY